MIACGVVTLVELPLLEGSFDLYSGAHILLKGSLAFLMLLLLLGGLISVCLVLHLFLTFI